MSNLIDHLNQTFKYAFSIRPKVGGFPVMAEVLRAAGVEKNLWTLPSCQSIYKMKNGSVVNQGAPLVTGFYQIAPFNREALIKALRTDQAGLSSFPEFLQSAWEAGVVSYDVDFNARNVIYYGINGESYLEEYPLVELPQKNS